MRCIRYIALVVLSLLSPVVAAWDSARLADPVMVNGHIIPYPVFAIFVMPGSPISAGFVDASGGAMVRFTGREFPAGAGELLAPTSPGLDVLEVENVATGETSRIHVFTLVPASNVDQSGRLNGYRIESYPKEPLRGLDIYLPPQGFVEMTRRATSGWTT